jgi:hypothetical protein
MTRGWPLIPRNGTIAAVVVGSFPWGSGAIFIKCVCALTNATVFANSEGASSRGFNDGWRSNAAGVAELSTVTNNLTERWRHPVKLHNPVVKVIAWAMRLSAATGNRNVLAALEMRSCRAAKKRSIKDGAERFDEPPYALTH